MHLVVGASGTVGSRVTRRLLSRGESVRAVSRDVTRLAELERLGAASVQGDLRTPDWMPAALDGVRSVVLASHGLVPPSRNNHPGIADELGNRRIVDAAKVAGVEHIVFVSVAPHPGRPTLFTAVKQRAEEHLKRSGIGYTIVRPTVFAETHAVLLIAEPLRAKGVVQFFGSGTSTLNWISAEDVADYIVNALDDAPRNRTAVIGGPDNMSRLEALALVEQMLGRTARRRHVSVGMMRAIRALVGPFHPGMMFLLDLSIAESGMLAPTSNSGIALDWIGPTTMMQVLQRWAGINTGLRPA
jgi:NADH dehydrogenase